MSKSAYEAITLLLTVHLAAFAGWSGFLAGYLVVGPVGLRLLRGCLFMMPVSLASGWALGLVQYGTTGWPWTIEAMQAAGLVMAVVLLVAWFGGVLLLHDPEARRNLEMGEKAGERVRRLVAIDLALGALILGFAVAGRYG